MFGTTNIYISSTLSGSLIPEQSTVLTWAEIEDVGENVGRKEGFYCSVLYRQSDDWRNVDIEEISLEETPLDDTEGKSVEINTFVGTMIDFEYWTDGEPHTWYDVSSWDARKQFTSTWN